MSDKPNVPTEPGTYEWRCHPSRDREWVMVIDGEGLHVANTADALRAFCTHGELASMTRGEFGPPVPSPEELEGLRLAKDVAEAYDWLFRHESRRNEPCWSNEIHRLNSNRADDSIYAYRSWKETHDADAD